MRGETTRGRRRPRRTSRRRPGLLVGMAVAGIVGIGLAAGAGCYLRRGAGAPGPTQAAGPGAATPTPAGPDEPRGAPAADSPTVSLENFQRIRPDMTQAQVEQILGPGVRVPRTEILRALRSTGPPGRTDSTVLKWQKGRNVLLLELHFLSSRALRHYE
jgi:hypothetical protein